MVGDVGVGTSLRDMLRASELHRATAVLHDVLDPMVANPTLEVLDAVAGLEHRHQFVPAST